MSEKMPWNAKIDEFRFNSAEPPVLSDIRLQIAPGTLLNIWGPSGSGKTTLFKILSGDYDFDLPGFPKEETLRSAQDPSYHLVGQKVIDELLLSPEYRETTWQDALTKARKTILQFGIEKLLGTQISEVSFGQARILSLACLWQYPPGIILLDEPFSGLDAGRKAEIESAIISLVSKGTAVVMSGHRERSGCENLKLEHRSTEIMAALPPEPIFEDLPQDIVLDNFTWPTWHGSSGIDLRLAPGKLCLITGPNGSGKSQLLFRLAGVFNDHSGNLKRPDSTSFMPQNSDQEFFSDTVGEELVLGNAKIESHAKTMADFMGIGDFWDRSPFLLSYGQKRRVSIAGIFSKPTALRIFDEPLDCLDENNSRKFLLILEKHLAQGGSAIIATHEMEPFKKFMPMRLHLDPGNLAEGYSLQECFEEKTTENSVGGHSSYQFNTKAFKGE